MKDNYLVIDGVQYLTPAQASGYLGYRLTYVYKLIHNGIFAKKHNIHGLKSLEYQKQIGNNKYFSLEYLSKQPKNTYRKQ